MMVLNEPALALVIVAFLADLSYKISVLLEPMGGIEPPTY